MKKAFASFKKNIFKRTSALRVRNRTAKKYIRRQFKFVGVWRKVVAKRFSKIGKSIVRVSPPWLRRVGRIVLIPFTYLGVQIRSYLARRPHRSFRRTRRRDYKRSLQLPGYWSFTGRVQSMLWRNKQLFGGLMLVYFLVALAVGGFGQQTAYSSLSETLSQTGGEVFSGNWGQVGQASLLLVTSLTTGLTPNVTAAQSVLGGLTVFFTWLATVWALRNVMANRQVGVRDAVYSSGAPVLPTVIVAFALVVQLLPIAIAVLIYNAAIFSGYISGGVEGMLVWLVLVLLGVLSLYWIVSTVVAMIVVTLPGMYPFQAIRTAGDLVVGRRLRILLRFIWASLLVTIAWIVLIIPIILGDSWIKKIWPAIEWLPVVPTAILLMSSITVVWVATYVYMLYRKVVDDDASPA